MFSVVERQAAPVPHCACLPGSPSLIPGQVSTTCKHSTPLLLTVAALCTHCTTHGSTTPRHRQLATSVPIQNWFHYITSSRNMRTRFLQCSNHSFLLCIRWRKSSDYWQWRQTQPLTIVPWSDCRLLRCSCLPIHPYHWSIPTITTSQVNIASVLDSNSSTVIRKNSPHVHCIVQRRILLLFMLGVRTNLEPSFNWCTIMCLLIERNNFYEH